MIISHASFNRTGGFLTIFFPKSVLKQCHSGLSGFPDTLRHLGDEYTLYYHALAGERDDGVTIGVHVDQLPKLPDWLPSWGVDGNLRERAEILLRSLPKDYRRICQPIGPVAEGFAELWMFAPKDMPIFQALSDYAKERTGAHVPLDAYDVSKLPPELITKVWVCDDDAQELAMGTEVAILKLELADRMRIRFESIANHDLERKGISTWDGESLPERVQTPGGAAFPALVNEGKTVGVRAFTCLAEAIESHRAGGARLLCLTHQDQVNHLLKKFPLGMMAKVELTRLGAGGTVMNDLILLAAEGAAGKVFPRSPDGFRELAGEVRGQWFEAASEIGKSLDVTLDLLPEIHAWIKKHCKDRNLGEVAEDLDEELAWLFRERFAWRAGFDKLRDYPRRLRAIRSRLGRIASLPLMKDLEKLERLQKWWDPWFRAWMHAPQDPKLWPLGWMLEEYRISIFAPDISLRMKVSEKRVEELMETAGLFSS